MNKANKEIQKEFLRKAATQGYKIYKNNIASAKPLNEVCGFMSTKCSADFRSLCSGR